MENNNLPNDCDVVVCMRHGATRTVMQERGWIPPNAVFLDGTLTPADLRGKHVIGVLPPDLIDACASFSHVGVDYPRDFPRGAELTLDQARAWIKEPVRYKQTREFLPRLQWTVTE